MMYPQLFIETERLKTAYYRAGDETYPKLLLLHGNLSSSVFFLPLLPVLSQWFDAAIPDLRCFGDTQDLPIDATRGYRDWSDDIESFRKALGWERFFIVGWSMGGNIAMQYAIDHSERVEKLVLIAPGSPFGFGGTRGEEGTPLSPLGLASGGGCANPQLVIPLAAKSRLVLRQILNELYFQPPFRMDRPWENRLLDAIAKTKVGYGRYPGNLRYVFQWPFVAAGDKGVLNAMSSLYGDLSVLTEISPKPPILWLRGNADKVVSDMSMLEFGALGSMGLAPGWPGNDVLPPQPMVAQTRYILDRYQNNGGMFHELVIPGGHMCVLESPQHFISSVCSFLLS